MTKWGEIESEFHYDFTKQSQFAPAQIGASSFAGEDYENKARPGLRENKVKQSQFQAGRERLKEPNHAASGLPATR
jgi:hypothetical protein